MEIIYKGVVCKTDTDSVYLVICDDLGYRFIPIIDSKNTYIDLDQSMGSICAVKFYDGTDQVTYEYAVERNMEDIFIAIEDFTIITSPHQSLFQSIYDDYDEGMGLWEVVEEIFKNPIIEEKYLKFINLNVWEVKP